MTTNPPPGLPAATHTVITTGPSRQDTTHRRDLAVTTVVNVIINALFMLGLAMAVIWAANPIIGYITRRAVGAAAPPVSLDHPAADTRLVLALCVAVGIVGGVYDTLRVRRHDRRTTRLWMEYCGDDGAWYSDTAYPEWSVWERRSRVDVRQLATAHAAAWMADYVAGVEPPSPQQITDALANMRVAIRVHGATRYLAAADLNLWVVPPANSDQPITTD